MKMEYFLSDSCSMHKNEASDVILQHKVYEIIEDKWNGADDVMYRRVMVQMVK